MNTERNTFCFKSLDTGKTLVLTFTNGNLRLAAMETGPKTEEALDQLRNQGFVQQEFPAWG